MAAKGFNRFLNIIGIVSEDDDNNIDQDDFDAYDPAPPKRVATPRDARSGYSSAEESYATRRPATGDAYARPNRSDYPQRVAPDYRSSGYGSATSAYSTARPSTGYSGREQSSGLPARIDSGRGNVVNMPSVSAPQQTIIFHVRAFEDCRDVILALLENKTVLLNMEELDISTVQRCIDMLGGAAFALNATLRPAAMQTYLIAPNTVDVAEARDSGYGRFGRDDRRGRR